MRRRFKNSVAVVAVILIAGCKPEPICDVVGAFATGTPLVSFTQADSDGATGTSLAGKRVHVILDTSKGMRGFTVSDNPDNTFSFMISNLNDELVSAGIRPDDIGYFSMPDGRTLNQLEGPEKFRNYAEKPTLYKGGETRIDTVVSQLRNNGSMAKTINYTEGDPVIVVSDLYQCKPKADNTGCDGTEQNRLIAPLAAEIESGRAVGLFGFRSPFAGTLYDMPGVDGTKRYEGPLPVWLLVLGDSHEVEAVLRLLEGGLGISGQSFLFQAAQGALTLNAKIETNGSVAHRIVGETRGDTAAIWRTYSPESFEKINGASADLAPILALSAPGSEATPLPAQVTLSLHDETNAIQPFSLSFDPADDVVLSSVKPVDADDVCGADRWGRMASEARPAVTEAVRGSDETWHLELFTSGDQIAYGDMVAGYPYVLELSLRYRAETSSLAALAENWSFGYGEAEDIDNILEEQRMGTSLLSELVEGLSSVAAVGQAEQGERLSRALFVIAVE